jgi:hypothetical protein
VAASECGLGVMDILSPTRLPPRAATMLDQRLCAIRGPSVQPAALRHAGRGRSGVLDPVASGAGAQLPARPSGAHTSIAIYRCEVQTAAPGQQTQIKKKPRSDRRTAGVTIQADVRARVLECRPPFST